jgi:hypothetical protein
MKLPIVLVSLLSCYFAPLRSIMLLISSVWHLGHSSLIRRTELTSWYTVVSEKLIDV